MPSKKVPGTTAKKPKKKKLKLKDLMSAATKETIVLDSDSEPETNSKADSISELEDLESQPSTSSKTVVGRPITSVIWNFYDQDRTGFKYKVDECKHRLSTPYAVNAQNHPRSHKHESSNFEQETERG